MWKPQIITFIFLISQTLRVSGDDFKEELFIKPLPPMHLYVYFQFITLITGDACKFYIMFTLIHIFIYTINNLNYYILISLLQLNILIYYLVPLRKLCQDFKLKSYI